MDEVGNRGSQEAVIADLLNLDDNNKEAVKAASDETIVDLINATFSGFLNESTEPSTITEKVNDVIEIVESMDRPFGEVVDCIQVVTNMKESEASEIYKGILKERDYHKGNRLEKIYESIG